MDSEVSPPWRLSVGTKPILPFAIVNSRGFLKNQGSGCDRIYEVRKEKPYYTFTPSTTAAYFVTPAL